MTLPVTVCIPTRNEEDNLPGCLKSLERAFKEIVVVDSGSTDRTSEIALRANATILDFYWNGQFPKKRNWALRSHQFKTPWVLFLDADERVTPKFIEELGRVLPDTSHVGFWISIDNWFMGTCLRHGDVFHKLALFRIGRGEYERFPEDWWTDLDMEIHEHPVLDGTTGEISARLVHHDYRGLKHYISKHNDYSSWEAKRFEWLVKADPEVWNKLNRRQRFKYRYLNHWWFAPFYAFMGYLPKKGFLDGKAGSRFALMKWRYFSDIRLKIKEGASEAQRR